MLAARLTQCNFIPDLMMIHQRQLFLLCLALYCLLVGGTENRALNDEVQQALMKLSDEEFFEFSEEIVETYSSTSVCSACLQTDKLLGYGGPLKVKTSTKWTSPIKKVLLQISNPKKVATFLKFYQKELGIRERKLNLLMWKKDTNLTTANTKALTTASLEQAKWYEKWRNYATRAFTFDGLDCAQTKMLREVRKTATPNEPKLRRKKATLQSRIEMIYSSAKVCNSTAMPKKCYSYEPGLINLMAKSRNYDQLLWAWKGWRDAIGPKIRKDWYEVVKIQNKGAEEHGYKDNGAYWRSRYHVSNFEERIEKLWEGIKPLYMQLHAFVRYRLHLQYGDKINLTGPVPIHVFGDIWGMSWNNIYDLAKPYKGVNSFEVTKGMKAKNITVMKMFHIADNFYRSMGLPKMTEEFWNNSMFVRPKDRPVVCYASAFNLQKDDVRVKMCAEVNSEYLYVVHHEMGHCQYYLAYNRHQPELFQSGANNGFHEAIGDTAALSVISTTHLQMLGILKKDSDNKTSYQRNINFLMQKALQKIAFYPFALGLEKWRWDVFDGKVTEKNLNAAWWENKLKYGGLIPPVPRTEKDFDPGAKYHVTYSVPYIRYFVSYAIQFQFYEALCNLSGHKGPLHKCDFAGSKKAGSKFKEMLDLGSSKHWEDAMKVLTGKCHMEVSAVKKYFKPLSDWLVKENKRLGNKIGWE